MRIGIVGYHDAPNYGTMLQAYALSYLIKRRGIDCEYIRYRRRKKLWIFRIVGPFIKWILRRIPCKFIKGDFAFFLGMEFRKTKQGFTDFHDHYIPCSQREYTYETIERSNDVYDYFIVGSDQTWSPLMTHFGLEGFTFLDFVKDDRKKFAYAPSIGSVNVPSDYQLVLLNKLKSFASISCREEANAELLTQLVGRSVDCVLDPTLLVHSQEWARIMSHVNIEKGYVLCYALGEKECALQYSEQIAKELGLPVYYVATRPKYLQMHNVLTDVGPCEWLYLIANAACVITDSFHGTLFSVNFKVDFYSFPKQIQLLGQINDNDRILSFLNQIGLQSRFIDDGKLCNYSSIDYAKIQHELDALRSKSLSNLEKMIELWEK